MIRIQNEAKLDEVLSTPNEADIEAMGRLGDDLTILGVGGKMGPSLALRARRAMRAAGVEYKIFAAARFTNPAVMEQLEQAGIVTIQCDLLHPGALKRIPDPGNVIFMAAMKFGTTGAEHMTWAMNTYLPGLVAEHFHQSRIVAFSSGNVYPLVPVVSGGATEHTPTIPVGEYAQSVLGRERMFEYGSRKYGTPGVLLRLNYANELRYGVLIDLARKVFEGRPVDVGMGLVNVIWQGDANSMCLRSFEFASSPPLILNITGPETVSVRSVANEFGRRFGRDPVLQGTESDTALLNDATRALELFGYPEVTLGQMVDWVAEWVREGGSSHGKPTHFETRDGRF